LQLKILVQTENFPLPCDSLDFSADALIKSCVKNVCYPSSSQCSFDLRCLSLPCLNSTHPILYDYKNCKNFCLSANTYQSYYSDSYGNCCDVQKMDCSGLCNGKSKVTTNIVSSLVYCCPSTMTVVRK
jgi:hypothetical protein